MPNCIVRNYSGRKVVKGGSVYLYGAGFSGATKAWFGNSEAVIDDYDNGFILVQAVSSVGEYELFVGENSSDRTSVGSVKVVDNVKSFVVDNVTVHSNDEFKNAMLGLMPRGFSWSKEPEGVFAKLMLGFSSVIRELYQLASSYRLNVSPTHTDSFQDMEAEYRLPEDGVTYSGTSSEIEVKRRLEIYRKSCKKGGCTIPYFKSIAALFGIDIEIYEYWKNPEKFSGLGSDESLNHYWMIEQNSAIGEIKVCSCKDDCTKPLRWWNKSAFENLINSVKPSHTKCLFAYKAEV